MMELKQVQAAAGAINEQGIIIGFGQDDEALNGIDTGVALGDRSHWGLLKITGDDRLRYLHNQSTNDFASLKPGQGCDTVFVTSTARTIDLATAYVTENAVLVLVSPNRRQQLFSWLDRFIFPFDKVELTDISTEYSVFSLLGSKSEHLLSKLVDQVLPNSLAEHQLVTIGDIEVRVARGSGLATPGYTLIVDNDGAGVVWSKLSDLGAVPFGDRLWHNLRIQQGRPVPDRELTEDYNPLEAGLWQTISFDKGCYIGQETIARLNTYNGVKQRLWGIKLSEAVPLKTPITVEDSKVGTLTSCTHTSSGYYGLGYVRTKAGGAGLQVQLGEANGVLETVPFIRHQG